MHPLKSSEGVAFGMATPTTSSACSARACTTMRRNSPPSDEPASPRRTPRSSSGP